MRAPPATPADSHRDVSKTILICSNVYPPHFIGGAELIAHYQAKLLKERGYRVIVFAGESTGSRERYSMRPDSFEGVPVFRVCLYPQDFQSELVNFSHMPVESHFKALLDAFSPNVVHMHNIIGLSTGIIHQAKQNGAKTVLTLHDHWGFCYKNTLIKRENEICRDYTRCAECMPYILSPAGLRVPIRMRQDFLKLQLAGVDAFISPSLYLAQAYLQAGVPLEKMNVIWNGVDVPRFSRIIKKPRRGKVRFTFIGHFGAHKGIDVFLDALALIRDQSAIAANLVGGGELIDHLRQRVSALGLESVVRFWGKLDNTQIEEVFSETDVQILPSIWPENQPVSITEAMASRTPVIASAIGGIPELVIHGHTGYLFEPGRPADLADRMSEFLRHPEHIELFGANGFQIIAEKSFQCQLDKICRIYA
jgi:glycosyltransferase involved in cell wall biosynthesis